MILYINQRKGHETVQIHFLRNARCSGQNATKAWAGILPFLKPVFSGNSMWEFQRAPLISLEDTHTFSSSGNYLKRLPSPSPKQNKNTTYRLMVKSYTSNISIFQLATFFPCTKHHLWVSLEVVFRFTVSSTPTWRQAFCSLRASCSNCWSCKKLTFFGNPQGSRVPKGFPLQG